ncbi:MAG: 3-deoxy-D-manno-octulosonic acid transferase [Deltaproteobacteria bacterium]|nr:MAG: 3-deoxy-D-manno-octulosonic acid transferase [Deltaproteobacteria bacterium]
MIYLLYDLLLCLSALILVPYYLVRGVRYGKTRRGIRERLGSYPRGFVHSLKGRTVIWVHAVSVGETRGVAPLVRALRERYPDAVLLLSHVTETGREVARQVAEADHCIFFPFDLSWVVRRVLRRISPTVVVLMETEIWPNFVRAAERQGIPVVLVNGRISDRSLPRYRMGGKLLKSILAGIPAFCMQTALDARRIRLLGATPEQIVVTGNLKFDMPEPPAATLARAELLARFRLPAGSLVWVAGSTHAGEERMVAEVYRQLLEIQPNLFLILVPRRPERARQVAEELARLNLRHLLRTTLDEATPTMGPGEVLLVDTIGEMLTFYALADIVFVGGSLIPAGGHNILEASLLSKPVVHGPHMQNFKEIANLIRKAQGGLAVADRDDLYHQMRLLVENPAERERLGKNGYNLLQQNRGATERTLAVIGRYLNG